MADSSDNVSFQDNNIEHLSVKMEKDNFIIVWSHVDHHQKHQSQIHKIAQ